MSHPAHTVFVVDDEPLISKTLTMILNMSGFAAVGFTSPAAALTAAETVRPTILISDVMMSEMAGTELAIRFRSAHPKCRVLLFSGQAATGGLLDEARAQGYDFELLPKPVHPADLLDTLRS